MLLIHNSRIPAKYIDRLSGIFPNADFIPLGIYPTVYRSISSHPDIFLFPLSASHIISSPSIQRKVYDSILERGILLSPSTDTPKGRYPRTASLNAVRIGKYLIHNLKITDGSILSHAKKLGLKQIHCNQGYARCSSIPVDDTSIITCDPGIAKAAKENNIETLLISTKDVILEGEEHGFLGGATSILPNGDIVFLGDITKHTDYGAIHQFLLDRGRGFKYLEGLPLNDSGTILCV